MAFEPTLPDLIRTSSGVLWAALGVALLVRRGQTPLARGFGLLLVATFPDFVGTNLVVMEVPRVASHATLAYVATAAGNTLFVAGASWMLLRERRDGHRSAEQALLMGLSMGIACAGLYAIARRNAPADVLAYGLSSFFAYPVMAAVAFHWARRAGTGAFPSGFVGLAAIALHTVTYAAETLSSGNGVIFAGGLLMMVPVCATVVALAASRRTQGVRATILAMTIVAFGLAELAVVASVDGVVEVGVRGVARLVAFGCMTAAALSLGWVGSGQGSTASRTRLAAAVALPALLIVAQIAQNFLSAQYGLLMGGVVAGALLVAARPIERALEGKPQARVAPASDAHRIYRDTVRHALRDREITRAEEVHLAEVAREMRLDPAHALRIRHEVEDERG